MKHLRETYSFKDQDFNLFLTPKQIDEIVTSLAKKINTDYQNKKPIFIIVLKGSIFFATDLLRKLTLDCEIETVVAKSYGNEMHSSGNVNLNYSSLNLKGKNVVIIEDIVDSGLTLQSLINKLKKLDPESLETVTLLSKPTERAVEVKVKYVGLEIGKEFVVGYGMDYAENGRNLSAIYKNINN